MPRSSTFLMLLDHSAQAASKSAGRESVFVALPTTRAASTLGQDCWWADLPSPALYVRAGFRLIVKVNQYPTGRLATHQRP